jgi:sortase B
MRKILYRIIIILLIGIIPISSFFIYKNNQDDKKQEEVFEKLFEISISDRVDSEDTIPNTTNDNQDRKNTIQNNTSSRKNNINTNININNLLSINNDIVGWIRIENTNINYPVMQSKDNPNYYLKRNFYKQYSRFWNSICSRIL